MEFSKGDYVRIEGCPDSFFVLEYLNNGNYTVANENGLVTIEEERLEFNWYEPIPTKLFEQIFGEKHRFAQEVVQKRKGRPIIWTLEACQKDALRFTKRSEWQNKSSSAFCAAWKNEWLNHCCDHMQERRHPNGFWTLETCKQDALKYNTRKSWQRNSPSAFSLAYKMGWKDECTAHMKNNKLNYSLEQCQQSALEYSSRGAWCRTPQYTCSRTNGWLDLCKHTEKHKHRIVCLNSGNIYESYSRAARGEGLSESSVRVAIDNEISVRGGLFFSKIDSEDNIMSQKVLEQFAKSKETSNKKKLTKIRRNETESDRQKLLLLRDKFFKTHDLSERLKLLDQIILLILTYGDLALQIMTEFCKELTIHNVVLSQQNSPSIEVASNFRQLPIPVVKQKVLNRMPPGVRMLDEAWHGANVEYTFIDDIHGKFVDTPNRLRSYWEKGLTGHPMTRGGKSVKKLKSLNTEEVFPSLIDAQRKLNVSQEVLLAAIENNVPVAGRHLAFLNDKSKENTFQAAEIINTNVAPKNSWYSKLFKRRNA